MKKGIWTKSAFIRKGKKIEGRISLLIKQDISAKLGLLRR